MPDGYLYVDGTAATNTGAASSGLTAAPVQTGHYKRFTNDPFAHTEIAYGPCFAGSGSTGNPWAIAAISDAGTNPTDVKHCVDQRLSVDGESGG
jgi:hypothetical protein